MVKHLIVVISCVLIGYGFWKAWPLLLGPSLSIDSPTNGAPFPNGIVSVQGRASRAALLTLNDAPLLHEENGTFFTTLTFPRGGSILTFVATDRFGKAVTVTRTIFVPPTNIQLLTNN